MNVNQEFIVKWKCFFKNYLANPNQYLVYNVSSVCQHLLSFLWLPTIAWWKKYCVIVDNLHELLFNHAHNFTNEDMQHALRKFLDKNNVQGLLPQFVRDASAMERKLSLLENLKIAYAQLVAQKSKENLYYKNIFLTTMVSNEVGPS